MTHGTAELQTEQHAVQGTSGKPTCLMDLPGDILLNTVSALEPVALRALQSVCKHWAGLIRSHELSVQWIWRHASIHSSACNPQLLKGYLKHREVVTLQTAEQLCTWAGQASICSGTTNKPEPAPTVLSVCPELLYWLVEGLLKQHQQHGWPLVQWILQHEDAFHQDHYMESHPKQVLQYALMCVVEMGSLQRLLELLGSNPADTLTSAGLEAHRLASQAAKHCKLDMLLKLFELFEGQLIHQKKQLVADLSRRVVETGDTNTLSVLLHKHHDMLNTYLLVSQSAESNNVKALRMLVRCKCPEYAGAINDNQKGQNNSPDELLKLPKPVVADKQCPAAGTALDHRFQAACDKGFTEAASFLLSHASVMGNETAAYSAAACAAAYGHINILELLLIHPLSKGYADTWRQRALQLAAECCQVKTVDYLLQQGGVNAKQFQGALDDTVKNGGTKAVSAMLAHLPAFTHPAPNDTPLLEQALLQATEAEKTAVMRLLLSKGGNPAWRDSRCLMSCIRHKGLEPCKLLLESYCISGRDWSRVVASAAERRRFEMLELLLNTAAVPDRTGVGLADLLTGIQSVLSIAAEAGQTELAQLGLDVWAARQTLEQGMLASELQQQAASLAYSLTEALRVAAASGHVSLVNWLLAQLQSPHVPALERQARCDALHNASKAVLLAAVEDNQSCILDILLTTSLAMRGVVDSEQGRDMILLAADRRCLDCVRVLLRHGSDPEGSTLVIACQHENPGLLTSLLKAGCGTNTTADPRYQNLLSKTIDNIWGTDVLNHVLCSTACEYCMEVLLEWGADVNASQGLALRQACLNGAHTVVKMLLHAGADPFVVNHNDLQLVAANGNPEIVVMVKHARHACQQGTR